MAASVGCRHGSDKLRQITRAKKRSPRQAHGHSYTVNISKACRLGLHSLQRHTKWTNLHILDRLHFSTTIVGEEVHAAQLQLLSKQFQRGLVTPHVGLRHAHVIDKKGEGGPWRWSIALAATPIHFCLNGRLEQSCAVRGNQLESKKERERELLRLPGFQ